MNVKIPLSSTSSQSAKLLEGQKGTLDVTGTKMWWSLEYATSIYVNCIYFIGDLCQMYVVLVSSILTNFKYHCKLADWMQRNDKQKENGMATLS